MADSIYTATFLIPESVDSSTPSMDAPVIPS
jgi:hypothetical protein